VVHALAAAGLGVSSIWSLLARVLSSFLLFAASHQNSPLSFQIEGQLPEAAHNAEAKENAKLESNKTNESKTSVAGDSGAGRRRWIVARPVGLARAYVPRIEHGRRL
jgi:hypothetical protein